MKHLILLVIVSVVSNLSYSQTLQVVSTFPENGAVNVNTDSVVITFNTKLNFVIDDFGEPNVYFFLEPEDSVTYTGAVLSDDSLSVIFYGQLADNTDYLGGVEYAEGINGELLSEPFIFQFTTYPEAGAFTVSGTVQTDIMAKRAAGTPIVVYLAKGSFVFDDSEECEFDPDSCESPPLYATFADTTTGAYTLSYVREGTYYPLGIDYVLEHEYNGGDDFTFPGLYYYDSNDDKVPDNIEVNSTTAPSFELSGIDLIPVDYSPFTFSESIVRSSYITSGFSENVTMVGGSTELPLYDYDMFYKSLPAKPAGLTSYISAMQNQIVEVMPDGSNIYWEQYFYDAGLDLAFSVGVSVFGSFIQDTVTEAEAEVPVDFSTLKSLPVQFIDSDSAVTIAEASGGAEFRAQYSQDTTAFGYMYIELLHRYWDLSENATPDAPVFWSVEYYYYMYDPQTFEYSEDSARVFINAETGAVIENSMIINSINREDLPGGFILYQNYPNPFNPSTTIPFSLSEASTVSIDVYSLLGQKVATLTNGRYPAGDHTVMWDATAFSSGVYIYRMRTNGYTSTKKLVLMK